MYVKSLSGSLVAKVLSETDTHYKVRIVETTMSHIELLNVERFVKKSDWQEIKRVLC